MRGTRPGPRIPPEPSAGRWRAPSGDRTRRNSAGAATRRRPPAECAGPVASRAAPGRTAAVPASPVLAALAPQVPGGGKAGMALLVAADLAVPARPLDAPVVVELDAARHEDGLAAAAALAAPAREAPVYRPEARAVSNWRGETTGREAQGEKGGEDHGAHGSPVAARLSQTAVGRSGKYPTAGIAVIDLPATAWGEVEAGEGEVERFVTPSPGPGRRRPARRDRPRGSGRERR
jgi:hypothetical protein